MKKFTVKVQSCADGATEEIEVMAENFKDAWNKACSPEWHMVIDIKEEKQ